MICICDGLVQLIMHMVYGSHTKKTKKNPNNYLFRIMHTVFNIRSKYTTDLPKLCFC